MARASGLTRLASVPAYFVFKIASAIVVLKLCASYLTVSGYGEFAQLVQFGTVLNLLVVGCAQNGLIRQSAAADDDEQLAGIHGAALIIWIAAVLLLAGPLCLASKTISSILVGSTDAWQTVIAIAGISIAAGPGQIWCSILSGRKRVTTSLVAQASGLSAGIAIAAMFIVQGEPHAAATAFAAGPLLTLVVAGRAVARLGLKIGSRADASRQVVPLIGYSAAFGATSSYGALVLFALRSVYRDHFGATALGYWIAANRISDMSNQLLGLFFIQFYVSHVAGLNDTIARRRFILRCWLAAAALMTFALVVFSMAPRELVSLFLSASFIPAIPVIQTYLVGDVLAVWASLAMYTAFARGKPAHYAAIEMGTMSLMAVIALALIAVGNPAAPQLAYVSAYAVTAILVTMAFVVWSNKSASSPTARSTAFTA